jgi:chemotaxis response regulator CheB
MKGAPFPYCVTVTVAVAERLGSEIDVARTVTDATNGSVEEHGPAYVAPAPLAVTSGKTAPHGPASQSPPSSDHVTPAPAESLATVAMKSARPQFVTPADVGAIVTAIGVVPIVT